MSKADSILNWSGDHVPVMCSSGWEWKWKIGSLKIIEICVKHSTSSSLTVSQSMSIGSCWMRFRMSMDFLCCTEGFLWITIKGISCGEREINKWHTKNEDNGFHASVDIFCETMVLSEIIIIIHLFKYHGWHSQASNDDFYLNAQSTAWHCLINSSVTHLILLNHLSIFFPNDSSKRSTQGLTFESDIVMMSRVNHFLTNCDHRWI